MAGDVITSIYGVEHVDSGRRILHDTLALCGVRVSVATKKPKNVLTCPNCERIGESKNMGIRKLIFVLAIACASCSGPGAHSALPAVATPTPSPGPTCLLEIINGVNTFKCTP